MTDRDDAPLTPADPLRWAKESGVGGVIEDYHHFHEQEGKRHQACVLCRLEQEIR